MKIFLSTAMSNVPMKYKDKHANNMSLVLKTLNDNPKYDIYSGLTHPAPINREINTIKDNKVLYEWYKTLISKSDIFIADVTYPSTGVGIELNIASNFKKPIYLIADSSITKEDEVSRMIIGIPYFIKILRYTNSSGIVIESLLNEYSFS